MAMWSYRFQVASYRNIGRPRLLVLCARPGSFDELISVDEASASNKIVRCLIGQKDTLALSSLIGCSSRNSSTVVSSYETKMKSAPKEQKPTLGLQQRLDLNIISWPRCNPIWLSLYGLNCPRYQQLHALNKNRSCVTCNTDRFDRIRPFSQRLPRTFLLTRHSLARGFYFIHS